MPDVSKLGTIQVQIIIAGTYSYRIIFFNSNTIWYNFDCPGIIWAPNAYFLILIKWL